MQMLSVFTFHTWCIQNYFLLSLFLFIKGALCDFRIILPTLTALQGDLMSGWELVEIIKLGRKLGEKRI